MFSKIGVRDLKTACGRCGAHAKCENNAKWFLILNVRLILTILSMKTLIFEVSDTDFQKQLVELYKMYYSLFFRKIFKFTKVISSSQKSNFCTFLELIPRMSSFSNLTYQNFQYDLSICEDRCLGRCFSKMCKTDEADPFADYTTDTNNQLFGLLF